jgi:signal transduction histidine kinase/orotate phosphoribosyltransferase
MSEQTVVLPQFITDYSMSTQLKQQFPNYLSKQCGVDRVTFNWSDVCFFDDYALIKLILIQKRLRSSGTRVSNRGFILHAHTANIQAVIRQLWIVGLPEIIASGHIATRNILIETLEDESELLESDPLAGHRPNKAITSAIPMLFCHERKHFAAGSREEKYVDTFTRSSLRPSGSSVFAWDLVENREFRHYILQQLRRNVQEHSQSFGLAIVRVWTNLTLSEEWNLSQETINKLYTNLAGNPLYQLLQGVGQSHGLLQISVVDDGIGIPNALEGIHDQLLKKPIQGELLSQSERCRYNIEELDSRFVDPANWKDNKARLLAFATDKFGTSKMDRPPEEVKGLRYLREQATIAKGGALAIESDGVSVRDFSSKRLFGTPGPVQFKWCEKGGTGIDIAIPMELVEAESKANSQIPYSAIPITSADSGLSAERIKIIELLSKFSPNVNVGQIKQQAYFECAKAILTKIRLPGIEDEIDVLRRYKLLIVDWSDLPESKRIFHYILVEIAKGLADIDARQMRPFIFADLPLGICGLIGVAINRFSKGDRPTPILAFTAEQSEPFWLGLDSENSLPTELRQLISCELKRKISDRRENRAEAFYRDCLGRLLSSQETTGPASALILSRVNSYAYSEIQKTALFARLVLLINRCSLLREERGRSRDGSGDMPYTGRYISVFNSEYIVTKVHELFLDEFRVVFTNPPVCFMPKNKKEGISLPHSKRVVARYFRSDALVDNPISIELTQKLTDIALGMALQAPNERIDWVVSCTSPMQWFLHRIVNGLAEYGKDCSFCVFESYEAILEATFDKIGIHPGENVLVFTDVIASGKLAFRMADTLKENFKSRIVGLISLADIRTAEDRKSIDLENVYGGRIVCLFNEPEPNRGDLSAAYYVHPETVVPKRKTNTSPYIEFFEQNYGGSGPLIQDHLYFSYPKRTLEFAISQGAIRYGHFQHGSHHSEIFVDVEKILALREYRNLLVTSLFRYVIEHDIHLIVYPSHSSAYLLADDLKQRFSGADQLVRFVIACRTFKGTQQTSYALTQFAPDPDKKWMDLSDKSVLILDDAVCTGVTVESIVAEISRIERNYYETIDPFSTSATKSNFSVHIVAFLNRLPRTTGDFWTGLHSITSGKIQFSTFFRMPLATDSKSLCKQCRLEKNLRRAKESAKYCMYSREFLSWWIHRNTIVSAHGKADMFVPSPQHFNAEEAFCISGYLTAIERGGYKLIMHTLLDVEMAIEVRKTSVPVRVHVRARAAFIHDLPSIDCEEGERVGVLCKEIVDLIDLAVTDSDPHRIQWNLLDILQALAIRYLMKRPKVDEATQVTECLFRKLILLFSNRLLFCGFTCILDTFLKWFIDSTLKESGHFRQTMRRILCQPDLSDQLPVEARWLVDWLNAYLAEDGEGVSSFGRAVQILARYAQKGRMYHIYGRSELDQLYEEIKQPTSKASGCGAPEIVRRVLAAYEQFNEILIASRVLRSRSSLPEIDLSALIEKTSNDLLEMRSSCQHFQANSADELAVRQAYPKISTLYQNLYLLWFCKDNKVKSAEIIDCFLPNLSGIVSSAVERFSGSDSAESRIKFDFSSIDAHKDLRVIVDPELLKLAFSQILSNVKRLQQEMELIVKWDIKDIPEPTRIGRMKQVQIIISNTGTPRPNIHTLRLRGLDGVGQSINEYGAGLDVLEPESPWTFQVSIHLDKWTEVKQ